MAYVSVHNLLYCLALSMYQLFSLFFADMLLADFGTVLFIVYSSDFFHTVVNSLTPSLYFSYAYTERNVFIPVKRCDTLTGHVRAI